MVVQDRKIFRAVKLTHYRQLAMGNSGSNAATTAMCAWFVWRAVCSLSSGRMKTAGQLAADTKLRSSKYLNNLIEQDHRGVKQRIAVMLGFKDFRHAAITIAGIELMHRIRKGQFRLGRLGAQGRTAPAVWNAVIGA